jgi:cyclic pyranopterin phosphate synthase
MSDGLSHLDEHGRARMVDVGAKPVTERVCVARAEVRMAAATLERIAAGDLPKGDVLAVARLAGIQAAKRTADWIPLAHPIALDAIEIELDLDRSASCVRVRAVARAQARTGVEMEALVGATAASLALYDMCKAVDRGMTVEAVRLVEKRGGKSGRWVRPDETDSGSAR